MPQSVADTGVLGSPDDEVFLGATHGASWIWSAPRSFSSVISGGWLESYSQKSENGKRHRVA